MKYCSVTMTPDTILAVEDGEYDSMKLDGIFSQDFTEDQYNAQQTAWKAEVAEAEAAQANAEPADIIVIKRTDGSIVGEAEDPDVNEDLADQAEFYLPNDDDNKPVWEKFADDNGIEYPEKATKQQIMDAVKAAYVEQTTDEESGDQG